MGREATATKRRVLDKTEECIQRTNQCITELRALEERHNGLARHVTDDSDELKKRVATVSARVSSFQCMTFFQRLNWLLFGSVPEAPQPTAFLSSEKAVLRPRLPS